MRSKQMRLGMAVATALLMAGCNSAGDEVAPDAAIPSADSASEAAPEPTPPPPAQGRSETVENEFYEFSYAYPAAAAAFPKLKDLLDAKLADAQAQLATESREDKKAAEADGFPYRKHSSETEWKVVTRLPGWLSLNASTYVYSGGAHGMTVSDSLLWDEKAGVARKPQDLFTTDVALRSAIQSAFCDALDKEREKRRGEPVVAGEMFSECIDPLASTVIFGSSNGRTFDRIGVLVAPYEAGPYAEGEYEVTLPVTAGVLAAVKPAFRASFAAAR